MRAYDIELLSRPADRTDPACHGWCFGLPPGIAPEQWPLDPLHGYPLKHGFTILLPDDHRVHGPDLVALSFFATAPDHLEGPAKILSGLSPLLEPGADPPLDPVALPFWRSGQAAHPRLFRMQDILEYGYAVILLTQAEFDGPLCLPPRLRGNAWLETVLPPEWLVDGPNPDNWNGRNGGRQYLDPNTRFSTAPVPDEAAMTANHGFRWTPRANDPNAGIAPREDIGFGVDNGYTSPHYWLDNVFEPANWREHPWSQGHAANHIGGTMRPVQAMPKFSPHYIGFDEEFGGYNFGTGNAQLDFQDMKFDWACG